MCTEEGFDIRMDHFLEKMTLHQYNGPGGRVVIPDGVEVIAYLAYDRGKTITEITIPDSVTEIHPDAFMHCRGLADSEGFVIIRKVLYQYFGPGGHVVIPNGVEEIGPMAFMGHRKVSSITIPDSVKKIDKSTFVGCEGMADPDGFVIFQNYLCSYHGNDERVVIPQGVTEIDPSFWGWEGMRELVIPDSVERVHPLFRMAEPPEHFNIVAPVAVLETIWSNFSASYKTQECVGYLDGTFDRRDGFANVICAYIKKNKKKFFKLICDRDDAVMMENFLNCLQKIKLDQIDEYIVASTGRVNLTAYLLNYKKDNYTSSQIQDADEKNAEKELGIREKSVADWRKTFKFSISGGCVEIIAYKGTEAVVVIPERIGKNVVTKIGSGAFSQREDITGIIFPDGLREIGSDAFICCSNLTEIVLPNNVTALPHGVFAGCTGLSSIRLSGSVEKFQSTTFFGCDKLTIHAPAGSYAETYAKENNIPFVAE